MTGQTLQLCVSVVGVGLVAAWGQLIPVCFEGRMPQSAGENVLALVLGEARLEISRSLEEKADVYFHGGVQHLDCEEGLSTQGRGMSAAAPATNGMFAAEADHDEHEHEHEHPAIAGPGFGGWQWIDQRVHEQTHRHLKGDRIAEVLPWLWAACKVSSKNVESYENGAYVLAYQLNKPEEGVRLLEEGVRNNPKVPELDFLLGEILFNLSHDVARAEPWFVSAHAKCLPVQKNATRAEEVKLLRLRAVFYLGYMAKQRGDLERVRACLAEAESLAPEHAVAHDLKVLLEAAGTKR